MDNQLSTADIEKILLDIRALQQFIDNAKVKRDQSVDLFKQLIANADKLFADETNDANIQLELLKNKLEQYFIDNPPKGRKSLKFAGGSFGYNRNQTKFWFNGQLVDANNSEFLARCKQSAEGRHFVATKEYLNWAALKQALNFDDTNCIFFDDTGEVIEGLRAQKIFSVKIN